ncbi:MAG: hypothetical protein AAGM22_17000 [Acidobacteriota bacterium]
MNRRASKAPNGPPSRPSALAPIRRRGARLAMRWAPPPIAPGLIAPALAAAVLSVASLTAAAPASAAPPAAGPQVGTNLAFLSSSSGDWPFVDVFKTSDGWFASGDCGWDCGTLDLDADGWVRSLDPGQMATAIVFDRVPGAMPHTDVSQSYNVFYDGVGALDYDGSVVHVESVAPGHDRVRIDPQSDQPFFITVVLTAATWDPDEAVPPSEYIRNIRVIAPGGVCSDDAFRYCHDSLPCGSGATCELFAAGSNYQSQRFHPRFLENVRPFSVLRFMDWLDTIEGGLESASDLTQVSHARWNVAPVSVMADLVNRLDVDAWVNVPHLASNALVQDMASIFASELNLGRRVFVEFSNETWNETFPAYGELGRRGCLFFGHLTASCYRYDAQGQVASTLCEDHATDPIAGCDTARILYTTERAMDSWQIFETAFDAQQLPGGNGNSSAQLVRVLASQAGHTALHEALLDHRDAYATVDVFATAAYFGWPLGGDPIVQDWDPDDVDDMADLDLRLQLEVADTVADMALDRQFLLQHDLGQYAHIPFVLYEGGQGLVARGPNAANETALDHANAVFDAANRSPAMALHYRQLLDDWRLVGGDTLFNHYVNVRRYNEDERYGALESMLQDPMTSQKYRELTRFIDALP